jgi:hypothetical protein
VRKLDKPERRASVIEPELNNDFLRRRLRSQCSGRARPHDDNGDTTANQIRSQFRQPIILTLRPTILDGYVAPLFKPGFGQALLKDGDIVTHRFVRSPAEKTNHWNRELLRA